MGFNDLATTHPELAAQAVGWDPATITKGSSLKNNGVANSAIFGKRQLVHVQEELDVLSVAINRYWWATTILQRQTQKLLHRPMAGIQLL